jgi:hypothetical protein
MTRRWYFLMLFMSGAFMVTAVVLWWPQGTAEAQCGSQASSCKSCHEVQAQKPVNKDGTGWHQGHAFGDFCANCHAGNIQATDKAVAHTGMIAPLSDIKANCAACHPNDTDTRAQKYAVLLGVQVGGGDAGGTGGSPTSAAPTPAPTPNSAPTSVTQLVSGLVDYNQQYAQTVQGQLNINWGNVIAGALIVALAGGGGAFAFFNERKLRGPHTTAQLALTASKPAQLATAPAARTTVPADLDDLVTQLPKLDPSGQRALRRLMADPVAASDLLVSLSRIDPRLIEAVRHLDRRELNLLMALAEEH